MDFTIKTARLLLRAFTEEDAPAWNSIANQPYILKRMPDWQSTVDHTKKLIRYFISQYPQAKKTTARVMFAVTIDNDKLIGMVGIGNKKEVNNEIELAYFVSEEYSGKGYISEAIVETDNYPSQRVVENCGFQKIDTRKILNSGESVEKPFFYYRLYSRFLPFPL